MVLGWCRGGCSWKCYKALTCCSLLTRCTIPCACHAKRHLNLQKWSALVFLTLWLRNVLRAATAYTFSTSEHPKVARTCGVFVHFDFEMCFAPQRCPLFRHLNFQKWSENDVFCTCWLRNVLRATTARTFSTSQLCKSGPRMVCFVHFDFEMCFAPQRRALFRHRNFQKWSDAEVFCTFWLRNVLRATTACNFSSLIWPAGSAPAALVSLLFDPPEPQMGASNHWKKNSVWRLSYLFAHLHLLSSDSFSSTLLSSNLFPSLCLCPALLFICPYCRKFDF